MEEFRWLQLFRIQQETHSSAYSDLYHVVRQGFRVRDRFDVPRITVGHEAKREGDSVEVSSMEERKAIYVRHCYPDIPQIVKRVRDVVHDYTKFAESEREWKDVQRWWNFSKESRGDDPMVNYLRSRNNPQALTLQIDQKYRNPDNC